MRVAIIAVSALIGIIACNKREAKAEKPQDVTPVAREAHADTAAVQDGKGKVINGETPPMQKIREEVRQTTRDIGKAVEKGGDKVKEETRQTARDVGEALSVDWGKSDADRSLSGRVRAAVNHDRSVADESRGISIRSEEGVVHLTGTVASPEASKAIEQAATTVAGKGKVENGITVVERVSLFSGDRGETEADKQITEQVRAVLKADKDLAKEADDIHISTVNREVHLTGKVATPAISKAIAKVAVRVAGGEDNVDNDLKSK